jgi:hypothetical protein
VHTLRRQLALICVLSICVSAQPTQATKPTLKEQVVLIPLGSVVEVTLTSKQKLRGRIGSVSDAGFDFQYVQNDQTISRTLNYSEVRSVKVKGKGMSTAAKVTIGVLAGVGGVFLVLIAIAAYALD